MSFCRYATPDVTDGGAVSLYPALAGTAAKVRCDEIANLRMIDVTGHGDEHLRRHIHPREIVAQAGLVERRHGLGRSQDRPAKRMLRPELLGENLVHQVVGRVLDHLDFFKDHALFAHDVGRHERRPKNHVAEQVGRQRQVLVEHLDVVAGVFLGRKRVQLAADRVDFLRDLLGRAARRCP